MIPEPHLRNKRGTAQSIRMPRGETPERDSPDRPPVTRLYNPSRQGP
jgi:hypothetical protein